MVDPFVGEPVRSEGRSDVVGFIHGENNKINLRKGDKTRQIKKEIHTKVIYNLKLLSLSSSSLLILKSLSFPAKNKKRKMKLRPC